MRCGVLVCETNALLATMVEVLHAFSFVMWA